MVIHMCVCACACVRACAYACVCVCTSGLTRWCFRPTGVSVFGFNGALQLLSKRSW